MTDRDDFLKRWSRRKVEARHGLKRKEEEDSADPPRKDEPAPATREREEPSQARMVSPGSPPATIEDAQTIDDEEFADVDFDKLDYNSDYTRFMKKGVSQAIQRRALRQLWKSDPVFAVMDGLNDYDLDYTDAATVVANLQTSWQVGRGYRTAEELAEQEGKELTEGDAVQAEASADAPEEHADTPDPAEGTGETPAGGDDSEASEEEQPAPTAEADSPPDGDDAKG